MVAAAPASAITLSLDSTYIHSCHEGERHLEVRVGNAELPGDGGRQVFGAVANAGTDIVALIRRTLDALGCTGDTALSAFTDGCSGLGAILAAAGVTGPPLADWFHLAMRLQHAKLVAEALPAEDPDQQQTKAGIITEVERLRVANRNHRDPGSQTPAGRARDHGNGSGGAGPQSLHVAHKGRNWDRNRRVCAPADCTEVPAGGGHGNDRFVACVRPYPKRLGEPEYWAQNPVRVSTAKIVDPGRVS